MTISFQPPVLYKKTSKGADQFWEIRVEGNVIITRYGQVDGKVQETRDVIKEGKNLGKANETTPEEQAQAEAQAKWEKQKKKRYVETLEEARAGKVDEGSILGGAVPMLAHSFEKHSEKIRYPAYLSAKLDGMRLVGHVKDGVASLWTRTQKPVISLPHIVKALEEAFPGGEVLIDGEAYVHSYRDDFNTIMSLIRPDEPVPGHEVIEYHIFDMISAKGFGKRLEDLRNTNLKHPLVLVDQILVSNKDEAFEGMSNFIAAGYEGAMIKNADSPYEHKRSYHIQKLKLMADAEFKIIGVEEGRGKLAGHVGSFICETDAGVRFNAKLKGETSHLQYLFTHPREWQGKMLTVQYQNLTPEGAPRFPVGKAIRTEE